MTLDKRAGLAGLATRELSRDAEGPGGWRRFLLAHLAWILIITMLVVGAAAWYARHQTPQYTAQATVNVYFTSPDPAALQGPNMVTEKEIVSSGAVLAIAGRALGVPAAQLRHGLSLNVPAGSAIMEVGYSDPVPWVARQRAQVIAESYVAYRSPKAPAPVKHATTATPSASTTLHATLITPAALPASPSSPNYLVDILAALVMGLALGIGSAAARDHLDDRLRGAADIELVAGAPVLALIPAYRTFSRDPGGELAMRWNAGSAVAEAYRGLRTRVISAAAARGARTLLVTSPAGEKRSMVAANLAVALAQSGRRTVLVCADLRWGSAAGLLGVPDDGGLAAVLDRRADLATALRSPGVPGLRVLPPGPPAADPAELLQRPALRTVLGELRSHADFVVIDAPPVLATPDTVPLAHLAEMVVLAADARRSTRGQLRAAMRETHGVAGKLIGCVLYNAGRYQWLRKSPAPRLADPAVQAGWARPPVAVDGYEPAASHHSANNVSVPADPS